MKTLAETKIKLINPWAKFKFGMTAETYNALRKADRRPREGTRDGRNYDKRRAIEYMRLLTGKTIVAAEFDKTIDRVRWVKTSLGEKLEIPNWDWTGVAIDEDTFELLQ
ncbi:hypothetical protein GGQ64_005358 [Rhizobium azooxidifex]|uniref:Uncharacterized protein n=1 Tax=Mycoplana azooxidifex TaxID=1636188 RepID=A0A7W6DF37_9HYPH|nr:hypothetical protein [Mycoplana azooxidifex]MBB3980111.1 hypothetical protein [Mycoplana azooxidifex]